MKPQRIRLSRLRKCLAVALTATAMACPLWGQDNVVQSTTAQAEHPSPDGRLALLYSETAEEKVYDLVETKTGKVLSRVIESELDAGPSARFCIESVLWKPDSSAFAVTFSYFKRGSVVLLFQRTGSGYSEVKLPELLVEIPDKLTRGKGYDHIVLLNSQTALQWQKDGSLQVKIENAVDGNGGSVTATRIVDLACDRSDNIRIAKSAVKIRAGQ